MQYLIVSTNNVPFYTNTFKIENDFKLDIGMIVFDFYHNIYTKDGVNWLQIHRTHYFL